MARSILHPPHVDNLCGWPSMATAVAAQLHPGKEVGVEDVVMALLELEGGALAQLSFGWTLPANASGLHAGMRLLCTKELIEIGAAD